MYKIQKILFSTFLLLSLICSANSGKSDIAIPVEKTATICEEGIHGLTFIQPESVQYIIYNQKTGNQNFGKFYLTYDTSLFSITEFDITNVIFVQDIDRCSSVSLLLFPYHIFW